MQLQTNRKRHTRTDIVADPVQHLEQRLLLSVSSTIYGDPSTAQGNVFTYDISSSASSATSTLTQTVGAPTTDQGQPATEFDSVSMSTINGKQHSNTSVVYLAQTSEGLVEYEDRNQSLVNGVLQQTDSQTYATPSVGLPATLEASTPVTQTDTEYDTDTDSSGNITQYTDAITDVFTLQSDTTQPLTVPAGTYNCYQVTENATVVTTQNGTTSSSTATNTLTLYLAQGVGLVEQTNAFGNVTTTQALASFTASDRLVFAPATLPNVQAGDPIQPAFTVSVDDSAGNVVTDASGTVTLTPAGVNAANPITGNTATLVSGVATFSNVVLTKAGVYQLNATDTNGDTAGISSKFGVGGDSLMFSVQPKDSDPDQPLLVQVKAITPKGKLDTTLDDTLQLSLNIITGGSNSMLGGTDTVAFRAGVARFTAGLGVAVNVPGTYTLGATALSDGSSDATVSSTTSDSFTIAGYHLMVSGLAGKVDVFDPVALKVSLVTAHNKVDKLEDSAQVQLSLNTISGGQGATISDTTIATFQNGVATFPKTAGPVIDGGGTFTLTATEIGTDNPASPAISKPLAVLPDMLRQYSGQGVNKLFVAQRGMQILPASGTSPSYYLSVLDAQGKTVLLTSTLMTQLPNLHYTVIPVSPGTAVDHSFDLDGSNLYELALDRSQPDVSNPATFSTYGNFLPFEFPGTYRIQFDPMTTSYSAAVNVNAAISAITSYTTPLVKAVDPVIIAQTSARLVKAGDTLTVSAHLWLPNDSQADHKFLLTWLYTGIRFQLLGQNSTEAYTQPLPMQDNATLDFAIPKPGKYHLVLSVVYTPGDGNDPFSSANFVAADGLESVTIPIVVTP